MAQQQPSLEAKKAFFAHFPKLQYSDDENDENGKNDDKEGPADDDELDPREQRLRSRHRRFFRDTSSREMSQVEGEPTNHDRDKRVGQAEARNAREATPDDDVVVTSSARATPASKKPAKAKNRTRNSAVDALLNNGGDDEIELIGETPVQATKRPRAPAQIETPPQPTKRIPKLKSSSSLQRVGTTVAGATKKRKKGGQVTLRPEGEQIFRGLVFYYIPDNEIAPARRLRIHKAREYGAVRTSDAAQATHVIVDRAIGYQDAAKAAASNRGGRGVEGIVMVNEDYPIDCMQFKVLLDWKQKRYRLAGQPEEGTVPRESAEANEREERQNLTTKEKLQLKEPQRNPKKWDYVPKSTPPHASEESPVIGSQHIVLDPAETAENEHDGGAAHAESVPRGSTAPGDELTKVINMMQEFKDLPLDDDDDETASALGHQSSSDDDRESQRSAPVGKKAAPFEERFACARAGALDAHADNPNARTVEVLQSMLSYYERTSDQWRVLAYRKAIATLKRQPARISTENEALRLPGVGARLAAKIAEIATTDRLRRLEHAQRDGSDQVLKLFLGVHGVGPALAARWAARGMRTLEDVRRQVKLTAGQQMGMERYADLNTKIPRDEVEALAKVVQDEAARVDDAVQLIVGGSYRRGAPSSGDVDMIISKPSTTHRSELLPFLQELVRRLRDAGFIVATLAADGSIWQGCCVLPRGDGVWRRMDMLLVPAAEMGAALIYFTGDDVFNRSMRLLARKKGWKLNQKGLWKRDGGIGMETGQEDLLEGRCERRIFELLGVTWREPTQRWCR
ncbi:DNA polymerase POL4 [Cordyceps militaris]|uniref:DNA polymerase lambda n=1 Tax=Cordyceps militaris TaxID=73501 RepID=A0A2H4SP77_CORMI|nr:DNA polymerase POL4 [Cordyceps militaris]